MVQPIRVLVVDHHLVVREGVRALLAGADGITVAGDAGDAEQAIAEARRLRPQVILMDLRLPGRGSVAAIRAILAEQPETAIVVLGGVDAEDEGLAAIEAGALGYLAKSSGQEGFLDAVCRVAHGHPWLPADLTRRLLTRLQPRPEPEPLTAREREVLGLLARGWSNRRISRELAIAEITVRTHVSHVLGKLGVHNRVEAALYAMRSGTASLPGPEPWRRSAGKPLPDPSRPRMRRTYPNG